MTAACGVCVAVWPAGLRPYGCSGASCPEVQRWGAPWRFRVCLVRADCRKELRRLPRKRKDRRRAFLHLHDCQKEPCMLIIGVMSVINECVPPHCLPDALVVFVVVCLAVCVRRPASQVLSCDTGSVDCATLFQHVNTMSMWLELVMWSPLGARRCRS